MNKYASLIAFLGFSVMNTANANTEVAKWYGEGGVVREVALIDSLITVKLAEPGRVAVSMQNFLAAFKQCARHLGVE